MPSCPEAAEPMDHFGRCHSHPVDRACARARSGGGTLQHVAVGMDFQSQRVLDAWVARVALVVVADGLARVSKEHPMTVGGLRLQPLDGEILLCDRVGLAIGIVFGACVIECVYL